MKTIKKLYDTVEKQTKFVKKKGNIITFKIPFVWKGDSFTQILVTGFETSRISGGVKVIGQSRDSKWYDTMDELLKAIDWERMEEWHHDERILEPSAEK